MAGRRSGRAAGAAVATAATLAAAALLLAGCGSTRPAGASGELTVFAAASLTASFTELASEFALANPSVTVNPISFDGSSILATQINEGAPVDVFASADQTTMDSVTGMVAGSSTVFAKNTLQIAVAPGNPLGITGLADLTGSGIQVVLCAPGVPCGTASHKLLDLAGVTLTPVSEAQAVKAVLTMVQEREADAGLVYVTDVAAAGGSVDGVVIDGAERATNAYPIAVLNGSKNAAVARAFVDYVLSAAGQAILAKYGFAAP